MSIAVYVAVMAVTTYLIRVIPFAAVRGKIKSPFINSVLYCLISASIAEGMAAYLAGSPAA